MVQWHIFYSGTVQGVGFRYTVLNQAKALRLKGWVRNLADGRVEALIEGDSETIDQLIHTIDQRFDGYIKEKHIEEIPARNQFQDFKITF